MPLRRTSKIALALILVTATGVVVYSEDASAPNTLVKEHSTVPASHTQTASIPPIDRHPPTKTEFATFAMG